MRASILALLAGPVIALASPALRLSVTVDEGTGIDSPNQGVLTTTDPRNYPGPFLIQVPGSSNNIIASPQAPIPGGLVTLNQRKGAPYELFLLQNGVLSLANPPPGPPLAVYATSIADGPPVLVLAPLGGGSNLRPVNVGMFNQGGPPVLQQIDPNSGPKPFFLLGPPGPPAPGAQIALDGVSPVPLQVLPLPQE